MQPRSVLGRQILEAAEAREDVVWRAKAPAPADRGDLDWLRTHVRSGTVLLAQTEQFSEGMRSFAAQLGGAWRSALARSRGASSLEETTSDEQRSRLEGADPDPMPLEPRLVARRRDAHRAAEGAQGVPPEPPAQSEAETESALPTWFLESPSEVQANIRRFVKSIEEDTDGWCDETRADLKLEFDLDDNQSDAIFLAFCSSHVRATVLAAREEERQAAARAERQARSILDLEDWSAAAPATDEIGAEVIDTLDVRACPHCHTNIEKNGGCQHMVCRACRRDFWWDKASCVLPW